MVEKPWKSGREKKMKNCSMDVDPVEESVGKDEKCEGDNQRNCGILLQISGTVRPSLPHRGFVRR
jgi:hypothetical protein